MATSITIGKVKLNKLEPGTTWENQLTTITMDITEEVHDDEGNFMFSLEKPGVKHHNFFAHNDLLELFDQLRPYMVLICEFNQRNLKKDDTPETFAPGYFVNQVTVTGSGENDGVVLSGFKVLRDGKKLNINTPNVNFGVDDYNWLPELQQIIEDIIAEAKEAYTNRKRKEVQGSLFDDDLSQNEQDVFSDMKNTVKELKKKGVTVTMIPGAANETT